VNQKISEARAKGVRDYLVEKGIDASRLKYRGYGCSMPLEGENTKFGQMLNRRVEVTVIE
jgi:outer membrane protein OmpA-like peptidoglycan-associated protein